MLVMALNRKIIGPKRMSPKKYGNNRLQNMLDNNKIFHISVENLEMIRNK